MITAAMPGIRMACARNAERIAERVDHGLRTWDWHRNESLLIVGMRREPMHASDIPE